MIFLSFFSSSAIIPIKCGASGQIDLQLTSCILKCEKKPAKYLYGSKRNSIPFCRFDKRFQGVATISAPKWAKIRGRSQTNCKL